MSVLKKPANIPAIKSSRITPNEDLSFLSTILAGNIFKISKKRNKIKIDTIVT